jgi:hypothetical protein
LVRLPFFHPFGAFSASLSVIGAHLYVPVCKGMQVLRSLFAQSFFIFPTPSQYANIGLKKLPKCELRSFNNKNRGATEGPAIFIG